jgi:hypothetical protein
MKIGEPSDFSGSPHRGGNITTNLMFLLSKARLINEYSRDQFDYDFTSLLISKVQNMEALYWFQRDYQRKQKAEIFLHYKNYGD